MKTKLSVVLALGLAVWMLPGCGKDPNDVSNLSREEQERRFAGDPEKAKQMGEIMKQKYMGQGAPQQPTNQQPAPR